MSSEPTLDAGAVAGVFPDLSPFSPLATWGVGRVVRGKKRDQGSSVGRVAADSTCRQEGLRGSAMFSPSSVPLLKPQVTGHSTQFRGTEGTQLASYEPLMSKGLPRVHAYTRTRDDWNWQVGSLQSLESLAYLRRSLLTCGFKRGTEAETEHGLQPASLSSSRPAEAFRFPKTRRALERPESWPCAGIGPVPRQGHSFLLSTSYARPRRTLQKPIGWLCRIPST